MQTLMEILSVGVCLFYKNLSSNPFFISLEGGEGSGKSTISSLLKEKIEAELFPELEEKWGLKKVVNVREPGSSKLGEKVRSILKESSSLSSLTETLLFSACRAQLLQEVIFPALQEKSLIICDRYVDSTFVYQYLLGNSKLDADFFNGIFKASKVVLPGLTLVLNVNPAIGLQRSKETGKAELKGLDYNKQVNSLFRKLSYLGGRFAPVNVDGFTIKEALDASFQVVKSYFKTLV